MTKRLVLDRVVKYSGTKTKLTVPDGEVWRVSLIGRVGVKGIDLSLTNNASDPNITSNMLLTSGSTLGPQHNGTAEYAITGLAFKLEEV